MIQARPTGSVSIRPALCCAQTEVSLDVSHVEGLIPKEFGLNAVEVPGARKLLASLEEEQVPWAIVTSATQPLVTGVRHILKLLSTVKPETRPLDRILGKHNRSNFPAFELLAYNFNPSVHPTGSPRFREGIADPGSA